MEFASFDWHVKDRVPHEAALAARRHHRHSLTQPTVCLPYTLNNIELHIRRGLLVAVVGKVIIIPQLWNSGFPSGLLMFWV